MAPTPRRRNRPTRAVFTLVTAFAVACGEAAPPPVPPVTVASTGRPPEPTRDRSMTRKQPLVENLHGVAVADPYRWLEDGESEEVHAWTARQNAMTRAFIDPLGGRDAIKQQAKELLELGAVSAPAVRTPKGGTRRYFHMKREGTQNQPVLYVRDGHAGKDRVLIDGSALSADGTTAIDWWYPSWDGSLVAWGKSESGSEESVLHVRDVASGKDREEKIDRTRHASLAWLPDGKSFFYSRYPKAGTVPAGDEKYGSKIFWHVLGTDPDKDAVVFGDGRDKTDVPQVILSPNGRWLVVRVHMGWDKSEVYLRDLSKGPTAPWIEVAARTPALFDPIVRDDRLYIQTNDGAPRYKLYAVDYTRPSRGSWTELLAEAPDVLHDVAILKREIVVTYLQEGASRVERFGMDGKPRGSIALPSIGSASVNGAHDGDEAFLSFTSYVVPSEVHRVDLAANPVKGAVVWDRVTAKFDAADVVVERRYAASKDGTRVPMYVVARRATLAGGGKRPTVLYGYGGFNVNQTPSFSARILTTASRGGIWVSAILRGGGELGEAWHKAGMREKKQNVFDDFVACAEALIKDGTTDPEHLGIVGGSNGGLLVAAAATQRPDLFRAGLSLVPLTDMVRYHRFRIAKLWIPEYGDPDSAEDFRFLHAYSPYHHVKEGVRYPALLFATAESDSRVDPMHARKMTARLQEVSRDPARPILLRVETKAGHGAGKPISKQADELADELTFLFHEIGLPLQ